MQLPIDYNLLTIAIFIAIINERIVEWFVSPLINRFGLPKSILLYVAGITGFLVIFISKINLFNLIPQIDPLIGLIMSGLAVGGGSSLLHDLFSLIRRTNK
jgi:hypothetical protein